MSCVTKMIVRPSSRILMNTSKHFCWNAASPTASTSSISRMSASTWIATEKARRTLHARRVVLQLELLKVLEFGELDHGVVAGSRLARREPEHDPVERDVVVRREVEVEADAELDEGRHAPARPDASRVGPVDAGQALQQRALAAAVASDDAEEFPRGDREVDVLQRVKLLVARAPQRMQRSLLECVTALLGDLEALVHTLGGQGGQRLIVGLRGHGKQGIASR